MPTPLSILIVEDMESDAQLLVRLLIKADYELVYEQVDTAAKMRSALEKRSWDLIVSDYNLPQFDGRAALALLKETGQDIPFVVVSGQIGEETAVAMMKAGAQDYLTKGNLARFVPAVERELAQAKLRRRRKQTETALRESEDRYRTLVESSPDSICIHCEGRLVYANAAAVKLFHASVPEDLIGLPAMQFIHPDYRAIVMERIRLGYENRQSAPLLEEKFVTLDGEAIEVEVVAAPIEFNGKAATQIIARDISERKRAEKALVESETKFRWLYEYAPMAYHLLTPDGNITDVNYRWCELLGYDREEVIGRSIFDFMADEEKAGAKTSFDKKKQSRQAFVEGSERNFLTKNGAVKIFKTYDYFVLDESWNVTSVQTTIEDMTERVQAETALRESQSLYHSLVEISPLNICRKDLEGRFTFANRHFLESSNITLDDLLGKTDFDLHPAELAEKYQQDDRSVVESRQVLELIEERTIIGGETIIVQSLKVPIYDGTGNIIGTQASFWDITDRKRAEDLAAKQSEQLRLLYEASQRLNRTLDLNEVYQAVCDFMTSIGPNDVLLISAFDPETQLITCRGCWMENKWVDVGSFPPIPLEADGQGTQSIAIRSGQPMLVNDYQALMRTARNSYIINGETNKVGKENPPDEETTRSALIVPLKSKGAITGVIQVMSYRLNAYTEDQLKLLEALALHIASAEQNALLYAQAQTELNERKQVEAAIQTTNILLEQTLEQSPIPMVLVSMPDGIIRSANSACRRFLGVDDEPSPVGMPLSELKASYQDFDMLGNPATIADLPLPRSLRGLTTEPQERHIIRKDGTSVYALVYGSPIFDAAGKLIAGYLVMTDITERKKAEQDIGQRVTELEMLYQSGLALSQLLNPKEIGKKILELLEEKLNWHHTRIRLYHPQEDTLELLDFNQPGLKNAANREAILERFQGLVLRSGQGLSGWVVQQGQPLRSGDLRNDSRYVEAYPGILSGLYVPMKVGERIVGVISIESEQLDAFNAADERLIVTLANQAASAFENARLFEETQQRVLELETLNRISLTLRTVSKQDEMLCIVLDEALSILNTQHGAIELYNKATDKLEKTITRGWASKVNEPPQGVDEGIAGRVFTSGQSYISHEFASDPETRAITRSQIPSGWGGIFLPIRTTQQTLGVLSVSVTSGHELNKDEIRLLSTLSEMTGAALQRMQLHEQTVRHLEQLNALRTVDQAIASSRDIHLTLNILLTHAVTQLDVDAARVLLYNPGSNLLESAAARGFHTPKPEDVSLNDSFAGRAIREHRMIDALDVQTAGQNPQFAKLWNEEGFACYWCVPLIVKGEVKGVFEVYRHTLFTPDEEWLEFLKALAGQAAITIDNNQLFDYLQRANLDLRLAYDATIEGWSRAMDLRDHETEGHTLRVTELTVKLARAINISESQLTDVRRGALLHDIGKMGVPDSILLKEGELTDAEWGVMRKHPQFAYDMLSPVGYLNDALDIPYYHHEKWDGTGYPQGLQGDRIPLVARIFAVVDVWDALTNDRTYRKKWTKQKARQYIKEQSGKHFDPQVVDVFLKNIKTS